MSSYISKEIVSFRSFQCLDRNHGIQTLVESGRYKAWFFDQYGVLHDGRKPYPGVFSTWKLAATGVKVVIISNSSRGAVFTLQTELAFNQYLSLEACILIFGFGFFRRNSHT